MVVLTSMTGEVAFSAWPLVMAAFVTAFVLLVAGAVLGFARLASRHSPA